MFILHLLSSGLKRKNVCEMLTLVRRSCRPSRSQRNQIDSRMYAPTVLTLLKKKPREQPCSFFLFFASLVFFKRCRFTLFQSAFYKLLPRCPRPASVRKGHVPPFFLSRCQTFHETGKEKSCAYTDKQCSSVFKPFRASGILN